MQRADELAAGRLGSEYIAFGMQTKVEPPGSGALSGASALALSLLLAGLALAIRRLQ